MKMMLVGAALLLVSTGETRAACAATDPVCRLGAVETSLRAYADEIGRLKTRLGAIKQSQGDGVTDSIFSEELVMLTYEVRELDGMLAELERKVDAIEVNEMIR